MARTTTRVRSGLVGLLFVLACIGITASTVAVWAHQTVMVTNRFAAVTSRIAADPDVQAAAAQRLASGIVTAVDVQGRIEGVLPGQQAFLAVPLTSAVERFLDERLTTFLANERAQEAFDAAIRFSHARLVTLLRNESDFVDVVGTTATIDLLPIAVEGLRALQEAGILPADITLPDVVEPADRDAVIARIESRLGRDLPADFALIPIASATRLATLQGIVRAFDIAVVVLLVITAALIAGTILLSGRRLRMVALLALGAVVSLVVARILIRAALQGLVAALATGDGTALRAMLTDLVTELASWSWILVIVGLIVAVVAVVASRPKWLSSGAAAAGSSGSRGEQLEAWARDHGDGIGWAVGILATVSIVWIALSPDLAILVGIGLLVAALTIGGRRSGGTDVPTTDGAPPSAPATTSA